jgi:hypothetical protein
MRTPCSLCVPLASDAAGQIVHTKGWLLHREFYIFMVRIVSSCILVTTNEHLFCLFVLVVFNNYFNNLNLFIDFWCITNIIGS